MNSLRGREIDRERDLSDYPQPRDYDREYDRDRSRDQDREISLGTGTILGIFFALALLCAVFFGFGYSMGRKSAQPIASAADSNPATGSTGFFAGAKPSPGSPLASPLKVSTPTPVQTADTDSDLQQAPAPDPPSQPGSYVAKPASLPAHGASVPASEVASNPVVKPAAKPLLAPAPIATSESPMPQTNPNGTVMVQVAAVSHQEDADLLLSALKNRGYAVFTRSEPLDRLLHVQVGPFMTRKDAEVMRQRLLADGYNAIVK